MVTGVISQLVWADVDSETHSQFPSSCLPRCSSGLRGVCLHKQENMCHVLFDCVAQKCKWKCGRSETEVQSSVVNVTKIADAD